MELYSLVETPTTASSCSTDPQYDNCPSFTQQGRDREEEMESRFLYPAVTRHPGPCSPLPGLAPVGAEVPTLVSEGRGPGAWPDHSYCSWRGGQRTQGWETELDPGIITARGGQQGSSCGAEYRGVDSAHRYQTPSPPLVAEHRSTLSVYDNLPDNTTPDSLQEVYDMETSFQEHFQEQMYRTRAPEQIQGLMEDDGVSEERSPWSSCEIILAESGSSNQDQYPDQEKKHEQEPRLDSGSCGFMQGDLMLHLKLSPPMSPPHPQHSAVSAPWPQPGAPYLDQPLSAPKVPPPLPLADPSASALRSILTSLQQQIVRQHEEYEARIIR